MKTYLLRDPKTVEPQKARLVPAVEPPHPRPRPDSVVTATVDANCGPPVTVPPALACRVLFIGLDVHNDSIAVSLAPSDSTEVRRYGIIGGQHDDVLRLIQKLSAAHPGVVLKFCYEAGPRGKGEVRTASNHVGFRCVKVAVLSAPQGRAVGM